MLQPIHSFNPLVWIAFACLRRDRELACDAAVLNLQAVTAPRDYGHALIKVAESYPRSVFSPGFLGVAETTSDLHERVEKISQHRRPSLAWIISGVALCGLIAFVFLTQYAKPPHEATAKIQVYKDIAYVPAEIEVIESSDVVVPAIVELGLDKTWARRAGSSEPALSPSEIMDKVSRMLSVKMNEGSTDVVYVTVRGDERKESDAIANAIVEQYKIKRDAVSVRDATEGAHREFDQNIAQKEQQLAEEKADLLNLQQVPPPPGFSEAAVASRITEDKFQIVAVQRAIDQDKAGLVQAIIDKSAQGEGVRVLAPAY